jgi:hypothetical protein
VSRLPLAKASWIPKRTCPLSNLTSITEETVISGSDALRCSTGSFRRRSRCLIRMDVHREQMVVNNHDQRRCTRRKGAETAQGSKAAQRRGLMFFSYKHHSVDVASILYRNCTRKRHPNSNLARDRPVPQQSIIIIRRGYSLSDAQLDTRAALNAKCGGGVCG